MQWPCTAFAVRSTKRRETQKSIIFVEKLKMQFSLFGYGRIVSVERQLSTRQPRIEQRGKEQQQGSRQLSHAVGWSL